ncbi:pyridoxal phosphate-dependent transferase [Xylaria cf. heliscus]|nr:pyridoxal phosphate-dependent transferase [Xylaria cf. heliscus]
MGSPKDLGRLHTRLVARTVDRQLQACWPSLPLTPIVPHSGRLMDLMIGRRKLSLAGLVLIDRQSVGSLAAFIIEPILSTGGILVPPKGYLKRMVEECKKRDMLVIMDEAQTGVGRTGKMFAFEEDDIVPDILCLSKTLGCGLPLGSVSTTAEIGLSLAQSKFLWLTTHLNDPLTAAVGNKVLEIVERDNIAQRARERGEQLREGLEDLRQKFWCIGDVRGRGLFQAIEIIADAETKAPGPDLGQLVSNKALEMGLSCNVVSKFWMRHSQPS